MGKPDFTIASSLSAVLAGAIPRRKQNGPQVQGCFDCIDANCAFGWAWDRNDPARSVSVEAVCGGTVVSRGEADRFRDDLLREGIGDGRHGFRLELPQELFDGREHQISVRPVESELVLQGSPRPFLRSAVPAPVGRGEDVRRGLAAELISGIQPAAIAAFMEGVPVPSAQPQAGADEVRLIAYYLPQFHPIPENDEWWGPGFTEWTNVAQAAPYFKDHCQPRTPGELGFYDLRLPEVREAQARLAREHGVHGFCYYYYWFAGRRLLERPLQEVFESGQPDFPFCICWANENWSRRWDGSEQEILVRQEHNERTDAEFIRDVIPLFRDPRYIKLNGAPLLVLYRISLMPDPIGTAQTWRRICAENGIPHIHLCMAETFGLSEPGSYGFDSSVQFPPHGTFAKQVNATVEGLDEGFKGNLYQYGEVVQDQLALEAPPYKRFPGVMTSWDNTPRRKKAGNAFLGATPQAYELWLRGAIDLARETLPAGERLVFINAWNEWAEGAHLEPDRKNGRAYLEATRRALSGRSDWRLVLDYAERLPELAGKTKQQMVEDLRFALERLSQVNERLLGVMGSQGLPKEWSVMKPGLPACMEGLPIVEQGLARLDRLNQHKPPRGRRIGVDSAYKLCIEGWAVCEGASLLPDTPTYLVLTAADGTSRHCALVGERLERSDVTEHLPWIARECTQFSGFKALVDISAVPRGTYRLGILHRFESLSALTTFETEVEIG